MAATEQIGVDLVPLARISAIVDRGEQEVFLRRILSDEEMAWCAGHREPQLAAAACLATKEAVIKLLGGRPSGFHWSDVALADVPPDGGPAALGPLRDALEGVGVSSVEVHRCCLRRTAVSTGADEVWSMWGRLDGDVIAVTTWS